MQSFKFYHPIEVRYGDLDPQGHVNNARYLTYLEQARVSYIKHLGLWDGNSFLSIGIILANVNMTFQAPILFGQNIRIGVRVNRLGNKSMTMDYAIEDAESRQQYALANTVLVAYDYMKKSTIPIPETWRVVLINFEGLKDSP